MQMGYQAERPLGYAQITSLATSTALTVPAGTSLALITPSGQAVRWRDDGTPPTAAIGYPLAAGVELQYSGNGFSTLYFIEQVAGATLDIVFYG